MTNKTVRQLRQGDVLLEEVDAIPENAVAVPPTGGKNVLALGEQSGHAHVIDAPHSTLYEAQHPDDRFLEVLEDGGLLTHEEHGAIHLAAGTYRVVRQREYDPPPFRFRRGSLLARLVED